MKELFPYILEAAQQRGFQRVRVWSDDEGRIAVSVRVGHAKAIGRIAPPGPEEEPAAYWDRIDAVLLGMAHSAMLDVPRRRLFHRRRMAF